MSAAAEPRKRTLRVALAGCGAVGAEFVRLVRHDGAEIERSHGVRLEITRVLVRNPAKHRPVAFAPGTLTADVDAFLRTPAEVVVEAIGGLEPAARIARTVLARGVRFVTANKALVAREGKALSEIGELRRGRLQFDAAVGGGVPIVRTLRDALGAARPVSVRAILNGTSNFVLTRLARGDDLGAALEEARRRGLAEADPTRDLDGRDAADKIAILAWLAYGVAPGSVPVCRVGLLPDPARLVRDAAATGGRLRLLAECVADAHGLRAAVLPTIVDANSAFGRTENEENRVILDFGWAAPLELAGPGAGGTPTAAALLADVLGSRRGLRRMAGAPVPVPDAREHCWSLSADGCALGIADLLAAVGVGTTAAASEHGRARLHTAPAAFERLVPVRAALAARGARPAIARLEPHAAPIAVQVAA